MSKTALICGLTCQDGTYLAKLLLAKGYRVIGTSRDAEASSFSNLEKLDIKSQSGSIKSPKTIKLACANIAGPVIKKNGGVKFWLMAV